MSNKAEGHDFIFTKSRNREQCRPAWVNPPPHALMDRWVKCHLIGDEIVLGEIVPRRLEQK